MDSIKQRLLDYLETLLGERPATVSEEAAGLPLFLRNRYQIESVRLFDRRVLLALETADTNAAPPGQYAEHSSALRHHLGETAVIVLPLLPSYARNRMVGMGIPFIVPGSQMFLPGTMIDLRERFSRPKPEAGKRLTPAAQCLVLYHLQRQPLEQLPLKEIAEKIRYSPIMLSKVKDELEAADVCRAFREGHSLMLEFQEKGRALWEKTQPLLSSPVKKTHWLHRGESSGSAPDAGLTALSHYTSIADDRIPTCALLSSTLQVGLENGLYRGCPSPEEATLRMERWSYDPLLLGDGKTVDPLSLYLSLRDSADERVQQQLEVLIDQISW